MTFRDKIGRAARGAISASWSVAAVFFVFAGCRGNFSAAPPPGAALRIVSLAPSLTEILFELGLSDEIVGVTSFCNYPPAAAQKEKIGDYLNPNVEKIASLKPDVIFALVDNKNVAALRNLGFRVIVRDPQSARELSETVAEFGRLTGRREKGAALAAEILNILLETKKAAADSSRRARVYVEVAYPPPWSCSASSFLGEALAAAGCDNIFASAAKKYFPVSPEEIIARNPDAILSISGQKNIATRAGFAGISAVRNGRIIYWDDRDVLSRATPRMIRAIPILRKRIFPDEK